MMNKRGERGLKHGEKKKDRKELPPLRRENQGACMEEEPIMPRIFQEPKEKEKKENKKILGGQGEKKNGRGPSTGHHYQVTATCLQWPSGQKKDQ